MLSGDRNRLREHTETVETRLPGEFLKWARTSDARYRQSAGQVNCLADRVDIVEDRVSALERKCAGPLKTWCLYIGALSLRVDGVTL
jgi:hypothetical protein